jgi:polar amino acid transport system ATP-binding protein
MKPAIEIKNLSKNYGKINILKNVSLDVQKGETLAIIGPSGAGKTTLLKCLNGMVVFDSGAVKISGFELVGGNVGVDTKQLRKKVGMVFQQFNCWPHKTVLENIIEAPLKVSKLKKEEALKKAKELISQVGLNGKENFYPTNLSGGQKQRVAIARALAMEPEVLLLDEITSALDPELVGEVVALIKLIAKKYNYTFVIVTHQMNLAKEIADRVVFMEKGEILEIGTTKDFFSHPKEKRVQEFLKKVLAF